MRKSFSLFRKGFLHPRVYIFILTGTGIIFLTFCTANNALEIAISGVASVFIGIGVNNFTSLETHAKDELSLKNKVTHTCQLIDMAGTKLVSAEKNLSDENYVNLKTEITELRQLLHLAGGILKEDTLD